MAEHTSHQPTGKPAMALATNVGETYLDSAAKEAGKQTVDYVGTDAGQQKIDDAKAEAQGLWAKYCSCFSSAV